MDYRKGIDVDAMLRRRVVFFNLEAWWLPVNRSELAQRPLGEVLPVYKAIRHDVRERLYQELVDARGALLAWTALLPKGACTHLWPELYLSKIDVLLKRARVLSLWGRGDDSGEERKALMHELFGYFDEQVGEQCFSMLRWWFWELHELWRTSYSDFTNFTPDLGNRGGYVHGRWREDQWYMLAKRLLEEYGMDDIEVRVGVVWGSRARVVYASIPYIEIDALPPSSYREAYALLIHELTHLVRYRTWLATGIDLLAVGTVGADYDEEGIALWKSHTVSAWDLTRFHDYVLDCAPYSMYWVHGEAQWSPPDEIVWQIWTITQWRCSLEEARTHVLRVYAGVRDLKRIGNVSWLRMDYLRGFYRVREYIQRGWASDALLHYGKIGIDDVSVLREYYDHGM